MKLPYTRAMVTAAIEGQLSEVSYELDPVFNVYVPIECPGVPSFVLTPRNTWNDKEEYDRKAIELARLFKKNSEKFANTLPDTILKAGPII